MEVQEKGKHIFPSIYMLAERTQSPKPESIKHTRIHFLP